MYTNMYVHGYGCFPPPPPPPPPSYPPPRLHALSEPAGKEKKEQKQEEKEEERMPAPRVGARVRVHGLQTKPELNNCLGTVEGAVDGGRFRVLLDGESRRVLSLRAENFSLEAEEVVAVAAEVEEAEDCILYMVASPLPPLDPLPPPQSPPPPPSPEVPWKVALAPLPSDEEGSGAMALAPLPSSTLPAHQEEEEWRNMFFCSTPNLAPLPPSPLPPSPLAVHPLPAGKEQKEQKEEAGVYVCMVLCVCLRGARSIVRGAEHPSSMLLSLTPTEN